MSDAELPAAMGRPALRALDGAGYRRLGDLAGVREADLLKLHGLGPKAVRIIRQALADEGLALGG